MPLLSLSFWPSAPKLNKQLSEQGLKFDKQKVKKFEQRVEFINNALTCGEMSHGDAFNTAKALADEINVHVQTYVPLIVDLKKKKLTKKDTKKSKNDKSRSKKTSAKSKRG